MQTAEIWLRMQKVNGLKTEVASGLVAQLAEQGGDIYRHLPACGLSDQQCGQFRYVDDGQLKATLNWLQQPDRHLLTYSDARFPPLLRQIPDAPLLLLVWGDERVLHQPQIAMVGSRAFSHYGERWGQYFAAGLATCGLAITSGLAMGIDAICHRAALAVEGTTIAVLGSGLDNIYPRRHQPLAQQIRQQGGAIVSEHWVSDLPLRDHFPRRNRIISGLSQGVLVVEASLRSGSLITARYALEQGRDVFALPGPLGSPVSEGTHWLIQQGGYLVTEPKDIAEQLKTGLQWLSLPQESTISYVEAEVELPFANVLANVGDEVTPIDVVAERVGQPVPEVVIKLLDLELAGWIAAVPGGYVRIRRPGHVRRTHVLV